MAGDCIMKSKLMLSAYSLVLLVALLGIASAEQPTQQYNKIYLNPFYRASLALNTNYTYSVAVVPPDRISSVINAMVTFNAQINGQTQTFSLWVDGKECNNPTYAVTTAFSTTGQVQIYFDCSNRITKAGTYTITLRSASNTGTMSGWLDLTYMNNPIGNLNLHGTEYIAGDVGKMFLQFLNADGQAVTNSECFLSLWYPDDTIFLNNTLMSKLQNASDGIYYKNFNIPNINGVYPASAKCYKPLVFDYLAFPNYTTDGFESNTWTGGIGWANDTNATPNYGWDVENTQPLATIQPTASAVCYEGSYCAKYTGSYGFIERGIRFPDGVSAVNISFARKFKGFQTGETCEAWIFDGNWHHLQQYNLAKGYTNNVWTYESLYLKSSEYELGTILLGFYLSNAPSTGDECFVDSILVSVIAPNITISNNTQYEILRGSGEVHVSSLYNQLNASIAISAQQVWNYPIRNLTFYPEQINFTLPQIDVVNYTKMTQDIWNYVNKSVTTGQLWVGGTEYSTTETTGRIVARVLDNAGAPVNGASCNLTIFYPTGVTIYKNNFMTLPVGQANGIYYYDYNQSGQVGVHTYTIDCAKGGQRYFLMGTYHVFDNTQMPQQIWNYINRNLTYYPAQQDLTNYTRISEDVWDYASRNLTYYPPTTTAQEFWEYVNRSLTYYQNFTLPEITAAEIWSYPTRELTGYYNATEDVWSYIARYTHGVII